MIERPLHVNVHLGTSPEDQELKQWVRLTAAQTGYRSMSEFVKSVLMATKRKSDKRRTGG